MTGCVMPDTAIVSVSKCLWGLPLAIALAGCAAPMTQTPRVVWVSGDRAYVAFGDSTALEAGDVVSFERRGRTLATGTVARVERGEMAQVMVSSGSLGSGGELGRITIRADRSALAPRSLLRIGFPSRARRTLFFRCPSVRLRWHWPEGAFRAGAVEERRGEYFRDPSVSTTTSWPDTLRFRLYDDAADEEIALERGELDVAVFWPGELSSHMRESPRWRDPLSGTCSRGAVALSWNEGATPDPFELAHARSSVFSALNRDLFRGDLLPLFARTDSASLPSPLVVPRFEVDPSCPGRGELQRYIDRLQPSTGGTHGSVRVFFSWLLNPVSGSFGVDGSVQGTALFAIRCPIVCRPELRRSIAALDPDHLAELIDCEP